MGFESANSDDPNDIIAATQRALVKAMRGIISDMSKDESIKAPGLTWEQIDYFLKSFGEKKPTVVTVDADETPQ